METQSNHVFLKAKKLSWWCSERGMTGRSSERCGIRKMCLPISSSEMWGLHPKTGESFLGPKNGL